jgi:hypothetical protein
MATESKTPPPSLLGTGAAAKAAAALRSRRDQLDDAEKKDTGYQAGGQVRRELKPSDPSPYGGERLLRPRQQIRDEIDRFTGKAKVYDKQAADAKANRLEAEREGTRYKTGGSVKAPSPGAIKAYSREYDTISPAGKNVHEDNRTKNRYAAGGMVRRGYGKARGA